MKKILTALPVLFVMLALLIVPVSADNSAQGQDFPAELSYYDAQINVMLPRLENFQSQYHAINGRYYQALTSHTSAPDVPTVPDSIESSPTDQAESLALFWDTFAELPDQLAWSFRIDTYNGPAGDGYVLTVETAINGETWMRSINYGADTWRNADWYSPSNIIEE